MIEEFNWSEESYDNCIQQLQNSEDEDYPVTMAVLTLREDIISAALSMPHLNPGYDNQDALLSLVCCERPQENTNMAKRAVDLLITHPRVQVSPNTLFEIARIYDSLENKQVVQHLLSFRHDYIAIFDTLIQIDEVPMEIDTLIQTDEEPMDIDFSYASAAA